jgi:F5/8 type C domain
MRSNLGVCRQSAATTALWIGSRYLDIQILESKAPSPLRSARALQSWRSRLAGLLILITVFLFPVAVLAQRRATVTVNFNPGHPVNRFSPSHALGAAIDGHDKGTNDLQLSASNIQMMLTAGLKSLTYRLRTELAGDVWHWNPKGVWSNSENRQGYWTSDSRSPEPISLSYGYRLPRRGNTIDQANDEGYSRLDDGDPQSFWKSNPYLDHAFTGENNSIHPQWIVIEFAEAQPINAVRLLWGEPFAKQYRIQYGNFDDVSDIALSHTGTWQDFPQGTVQNGRGGEAVLRLAPSPIKARWLRILLIESSETTSQLSSDVRDHLGFAMREISAGFTDAKGEFHDRVKHAANRRSQTIIHVSSTDPWHQESDLDEGVEQVGLDRIYQNGLTNGLPMLLPTGLAYDTPENAANEIRYVRDRGYKVERVELGEEPDGQYLTPEDFGALYLQWADAIHRVDPTLKLGGPSFQEILPDDQERTYRLGNSEWMRRFLDYLQRRGRASEYSFFSFEWYPFDDVCAPVAPQLARAPRMLEGALREMQRRGLSPDIPWIISEYGYSAFSTRAEIDIEGALLNADIVGKFLTLGGDQAFLFGYTPGFMGRDVPCTAGNNMLLSMDGNGGVKDRFATYFGARLLTQEWLQRGDEVHQLYQASSNIRDKNGDELITAYAVLRPDNQWSLLLINKDPVQTYQTTISFRKSVSGAVTRFTGQVDTYQYSRKQYVLGGPLDDPYPIKAEEPEHEVLQSFDPKSNVISLPAYSLTVIRGKLNR